MIGRRHVRLVMSDADSRHVIELFGPLLARNQARRRRLRACAALAIAAGTSLLIAASRWLAWAGP